jgi:hypothetical protein
MFNEKKFFELSISIGHLARVVHGEGRLRKGVGHSVLATGMGKRRRVAG